jgi:hypothetical protein
LALARARCGSGQQSVSIRGGGGGGGAQHRHLTVRQVDLHAHLLRARVGNIMKTYRRQIGEHFEPERNERAVPRSSADRRAAIDPGVCEFKGVRNLEEEVLAPRCGHDLDADGQAGGVVKVDRD